MKIYINGKFVSPDKARVSVYDRGFLYGDSVFETLRVYEGKPFMLRKHLLRLFNSARAISLKLPWKEKTLISAMEQTLRRNHIQNALLRITVTRGAGAHGLNPLPCKNPSLLIIPVPMPHYPETFYTKGVSVITSRYKKSSVVGIPSFIKSGNYLLSVLAKGEAARLRAFDAVFMDEKNNITEATASNVFTVTRENILMTPPVSSAILPGVTRNVILSAARKHGIKTREKNIPLRDVFKCREAFLANTSMEVMPVTRWDGRNIGAGKPGPVTKKIHTLLKQEVKKSLGI